VEPNPLFWNSDCSTFGKVEPNPLFGKTQYSDCSTFEKVEPNLLFGKTQRYPVEFTVFVPPFQMWSQIPICIVIDTSLRYDISKIGVWLHLSKGGKGGKGGNNYFLYIY
jgi:hypothetical protein